MLAHVLICRCSKRASWSRPLAVETEGRFSGRSDSFPEALLKRYRRRNEYEIEDPGSLRERRACTLIRLTKPMALSTPEVTFTQPDTKPRPPAWQCSSCSTVLFLGVAFLGLLRGPLWISDAVAWLCSPLRKAALPRNATEPGRGQHLVLEL